MFVYVYVYTDNLLRILKFSVLREMINDYPVH